MAVKLTTGFAPEWYVPKSERSNKADPARFLIAPVPHIVLLEIGHAFEVAKSDSAAYARGIEAACRAGIGAWENVRDETGAPVPFDPDRIMQLDLILLHELGKAVWERNLLGEDEAKNSAAPSGSSTTPPSGRAADADAGGTVTADGAQACPTNGKSPDSDQPTSASAGP